MYAAVPDPYCYPGTDVLKNKQGFRDRAKLEAFEAEITAQRAIEPVGLAITTIGRFIVTCSRMCMSGRVESGRFGFQREEAHSVTRRTSTAK